MIFNLLIVALVIGITAMWAIRGTGRGLFSSMLTCVCVIVSGAVAFGLWEPITYKFLLRLNEDMAWGLGLIIPFAISMVITRLLAEALVPKNLDFSDAVNFIGGAVFGLVSAVITVGIIALSLSFFRFGPSIMGYESVVTQKGGSLVYAKPLWIPVDKLTVAFYEHLSRGAFATPTPLAVVDPKLYEQAAMQRMVYTLKSDKGAYIARNSIKGDEFEVRGTYRVTGADPLTYETVDANGEAKRIKQDVTTPEGTPVPPQSEVAGFVVEFKAQASEKSGQVVIGPGQVRLVGRQANGEPFSAMPFSIVASPEAGSGRMHRFPMNASGLFIPSVGGASTSYFAFEFAIPQGATPENLYVKNYRVPVGDLQPQAQYASGEKRDEAVDGGDLFSKFGITIGGLADVDKSESVEIFPSNGPGNFGEVINNATLPLGYVIATTTGTKGLEIAEFDKEKYITGGEGQFSVEDLKQRGVDRNLRVEKFATKRDTGIVQVSLKVDGNANKLGKAVESSTADGPPRLIDSKGRAYEAVGWIYAETGTVNIRFKPGEPLRSLSDLPSALSSSKRDQTCFLIFQPTVGVTIDGFLIGKNQIASFKGGVEVRATK